MIKYTTDRNSDPIIIYCREDVKSVIHVVNSIVDRPLDVTLVKSNRAVEMFAYRYAKRILIKLREVNKRRKEMGWDLLKATDITIGGRIKDMTPGKKVTVYDFNGERI